jgi:hypothetical protein
MTWSGGLAEWQEGETLYMSVAFTYLLNEAYQRAQFAKAQGLRVIVGGPALFLVRKQKMQHPLTLLAEVQQTYPDAVAKHNPDATFASRGCPVGCSFCIVPQMEGREFTLIPDFPVRPILCDNNLSALPPEFQDHIIERYVKHGVRLIDANSGFEPRTFTTDVYERWKGLINAGGGPWRFAFDDWNEAIYVDEVFRMLWLEPSRRKRVYVLIGNEPFKECMARIEAVIRNRCEPHVQPYLDLNTMTREPRARFDWTPQMLKDVARWGNGFLWRPTKKHPDGIPFAEYDREAKKKIERYDEQQGLFV